MASGGISRSFVSCPDCNARNCDRADLNSTGCKPWRVTELSSKIRLIPRWWEHTKGQMHPRPPLQMMEKVPRGGSPVGATAQDSRAAPDPLPAATDGQEDGGNPAKAAAGWNSGGGGARRDHQVAKPGRQMIPDSSAAGERWVHGKAKRKSGR